jgi:hypothetical protein
LEIFSSSGCCFSSILMVATPFTSAAGVSVRPIPRGTTLPITFLYSDLLLSIFFALICYKIA